VKTIVRGASLDGYPFFVETVDGRIFSGRVDSDRLLPRVNTSAEKQLLDLLGR